MSLIRIGHRWLSPDAIVGAHISHPILPSGKVEGLVILLSSGHTLEFVGGDKDEAEKVLQSLALPPASP